MAARGSERQLEFFEATRATHHPSAGSGRGVFLHLRHDQALLSSIIGLIGLTVIFACGVERGKQLARTERMILARSPQAMTEPPAASAEPQAGETGTPSEPSTKTEKADQKLAPAPSGGPQMKRATKLASASTSSATPPAGRGGRFAVQVVTYSRTRLARQELERLRAEGERAFLVIKGDRTVVYVGPFPSRGLASQKQLTLRTRYQDCFIKTL